MEPPCCTDDPAQGSKEGKEEAAQLPSRSLSLVLVNKRSSVRPMALVLRQKTWSISLASGPLAVKCGSTVKRCPG